MLLAFAHPISRHHLRAPPGDAAGGGNDLLRDKALRAQRELVIEHNTGTNKDPMALAIVRGLPEGRHPDR